MGANTTIMCLVFTLKVDNILLKNKYIYLIFIYKFVMLIIMAYLLTTKKGCVRYTSIDEYNMIRGIIPKT